MLHKLINLNSDLKQLWNEGYEVEISDNHLLIHHVPYLNSQGKINYGTLVSTLHLAGDTTLKPDTHVTYFIGEAPCYKDGRTIDAIINSTQTQKLTSQITVNHTFSSKPASGYLNYFKKMSTYINIISAPAKSVDESVTEKTFKIIKPRKSKSVFNYADTNSSRAKISFISEKLAKQKIAIIGLGGTGAYILDLVSKTPVSEIHTFDGDIYKSHNAFRTPGATPIQKLRLRIFKTEYLKQIYSKMHRKIISHNYYVDSTNLEELSDMDFVFLSVDKGSVKEEIINCLESKGISFIDVGIGIQNVDDKLRGAVRVTTSTEQKRDHVRNRISLTDETLNEYAENIQTAELNALNASLAVIKWKKLSGFYHDFEKENHSEYTINSNLLTSIENDS
ncbi:MAG: ThiF family adenylyltransferase [Pyrinomonadaceae bacterium]